MSAHLFRQRVNIHPPPECWIIIPRTEIIDINIKLLLIFLPAKLVFIRIVHIGRYGDYCNPTAIVEDGFMLGVITCVGQSPYASQRAGEGIMVFINRERQRQFVKLKLTTSLSNLGGFCKSGEVR